MKLNDLLEAIIPDSKDMERAEKYNFDSKKQEQQAKAIKDLDKCVRRGIAFETAKKATHFPDNALGYDPFYRRAKELGATPEMLKDYEDTVKDIRKGNAKDFHEKDMLARAKLADSIPTGLTKYITSARDYVIKKGNKTLSGRIYCSPSSIANGSSHGWSGDKYTLVTHEDKHIDLEVFHSATGIGAYKHQIELIKKYKIKEA